MPFCPQCGIQNPDSARFCDQCGAQLIPVNQPAAPTPPAAPAAPAFTGATMVSAGPASCPQCGTAVIPGEAFCDNCGAALLAPAPAAPAAPAPSLPFSGVPPQPSYPPPQPVAPPAPQPAAPAPPPIVTPPIVTPPIVTPPQPAAPTPPAAPARAALAPASLTVASSGAVLALPAAPEAVLGRADPVSNFFPDVDMTPHGALEHGVGRRHARIFVSAGQLLVEDLDSTNGTFLNTSRLAPRQPAPLKSGDELRLGNLILRVQL